MSDGRPEGSSSRTAPALPHGTRLGWSKVKDRPYEREAWRFDRRWLPTTHHPDVGLSLMRKQEAPWSARMQGLIERLERLEPVIIVEYSDALRRSGAAQARGDQSASDQELFDWGALQQTSSQ